MTPNDQETPDIKLQSQKIKHILNDYTKAIQQKMYSNEDLLLDQLQQKTSKLKQTIAFYKKQTSPENIDKLISEKRHEKELQRLELEIQWRNLTEKYKKLQQDQKRLNQENKQSLFDIQNLQKKIAQLKEANQTLQNRVHNLKHEIDDRHFMTEIKPSYISPYKFKPFSTQESFLYSKTQKSTKRSNDFRSKFQKKTRFMILDKQNKLKKPQSQRLNETTSFSNFLLNKNKFKSLKDNLLDMTIQMRNNYTFPQKKIKQVQKSYLTTGEKYKQLIHYLEKAQVRQKIFDLLKKQSLLDE